MSEYRLELSKLEGEIHDFNGEYEFSGCREDGIDYIATLMLKDIHVTNKDFVADHLWLDFNKELSKYYPLEKGDRLFFSGEVVMYKTSSSYNANIENISNVTVIRKGKIVSTHKELKQKEMIEDIVEENKDFYKAKNYFLDALEYAEYMIPMPVFMEIDDVLITREEFKKFLEKREDFIQLYQDVKNNKKKFRIVFKEKINKNVFRDIKDIDYGNIEKYIENYRI